MDKDAATEKIDSPLLLVHGFGLRSEFWDGFIPLAEGRFTRVRAINLALRDIDSGVAELKQIVSSEAERSGRPVILMGHSLGGVLSALAAKDLGPESLRGLVLVSSPFGPHRGELPYLTQFLIWKNLLPLGYVRRHYFFGKDIADDKQAWLFAQAVAESPALLKTVSTRPWFHTLSFLQKLNVPSLVMGSAADRIVPSRQCRAFAEAIGAQYLELPKELKVGHDDYGMGGMASRELLNFTLSGFQL